MNWFSNPTPKKLPDDAYRDRKNEETKAVVDDFIEEMKKALRDLQATSAPERKDFPIASAVRRSTR